MGKTDYYQQFSEAAKDRVKVYVLQRDGLVKTIKQARKNLSDEQVNAQKLRDRIAELKSLSSVSLTDDSLSFDKFKTSLKKLTADLETSDEVCATLTGEVIPKKESELKTAETNVKNLLQSFLLECRPVADQNIQVVLNAAMDERESFISAFRKIFTDSGETLIVNDESQIPGAWLAREVLEPNLNIVEQAAIKAAAAGKAPEPVESKENDSQTSAG